MIAEPLYWYCAHCGDSETADPLTSASMMAFSVYRACQVMTKTAHCIVALE